MKRINSQGLSVFFFLKLLVPIILGFMIGWSVNNRFINEEIEEVDSDIAEVEKVLQHASRFLSTLPKSTSIQVKQRRINELKDKLLSNNQSSPGVLAISSIESPEFNQMAKLVSQFASFMDENGMVVVESKKGRESNENIQIRELIAQGSWDALCNALTASEAMEGLIIQSLTITKIRDDAELKLELQYTFNKQVEK